VVNQIEISGQLVQQNLETGGLNWPDSFKTYVGPSC